MQTVTPQQFPPLETVTKSNLTTATPSPMLEKLLRQYIAELAEAEKPASTPKQEFTPPPGWPADFVPLHLESRTHVTTAVMCKHILKQPQTARGWACHEDGPIRPIRINGRLAWPVLEIKRLLGLAPSQKGFSSIALLLVVAMLAGLALFAPGIPNSIDWAGVALLGAGVIGNRDRMACHNAEGKLQKPDDHYGLCPECHAEPELLNIGRNHFGVCHTHKIYWLIGSNLFSGWRDEDPAVWKSNEFLMDTYNQASPFYYPPKPVLKVTKNPNRPQLATPLKFLQEVTTRLQVDTERTLTGCTRIGVFSQGFWWGVRDGAPDEFQIAIEATTACFEDSDAVSIFIRKDVPVNTAQAILKAASHTLKDIDSLEPFTPIASIDPRTCADPDSIPF